MTYKLNGKDISCTLLIILFCFDIKFKLILWKRKNNALKMLNNM